MTDKERLRNIIHNAQNKYLNLLKFESSTLADYLIENGAIIPPCKVGDTVYDISEFVNGCSYPEIYEYKCDYITIFKDKDGETVFEIDAINFRLNDFGKTVFLTREDAAKALREREGE